MRQNCLANSTVEAMSGERAHRLCAKVVGMEMGRGRGPAGGAELPRTGSFPRRGERTVRRAPAHSQADAEPTAQRDLGKIRSLDLQFMPELTAIVTAVGPPFSRYESQRSTDECRGATWRSGNCPARSQRRTVFRFSPTWDRWPSVRCPAGITRLLPDNVRGASASARD